MPAPCLTPACLPSVPHVRLAHMVKILCEFYGDAYYTLPALAKVTMAGDVIRIYERDSVTWPYAVNTFDRHIGGDVSGYSAAILGGN